MKKTIISLLIIITGIFISSSVPVRQAFANKCGDVETSIIECDDNENGIDHILNLVVDIMTIGVGILGVVGISVVGIQYLTAGGSEEKTRKAKRRLFEIIIGLVVYAIFYAVLTFLGVNKT